VQLAGDGCASQRHIEQLTGAFLVPPHLADPRVVQREAGLADIRVSRTADAGAVRNKDRYRTAQDEQRPASAAGVTVGFRVVQVGQRRNNLKADFVHMPVGLFTKDAETIAESLASKEVSPHGPAAGMRMLSFYITNSSRCLSPSRRRALEKARKILSARIEEAFKKEERRKIA
jgi:tRNA(adenine34) deaminase